MLAATGVSAHLGLDTRVGGQESIDDATQSSEEVSTGAPTGSTLFGLYNVLGNQVAKILGVINPGLRMLYNAGVPGYIVGGPGTIGLLPPIATVIQAWGIAKFLRGI
jgi:hypothetical protein